MDGTDLIVRAPIEVVSFEEIKAQTIQIGKFYKGIMVDGTDYGVIPGTNKPTLLKPGAELLRLWGGFTPEFHVDNTGTNLERGIFCYEVKCSLLKNGELIGEGVGSCNSLESKYRYRWVNERALPPNIDKASLTYKENTNKATGGKWRTYRLDNENPQDLANTILKMAKKRAFIDAILTVTGASRIFTQDVEDIPVNGHADAKPVSKQSSKKNRQKGAAASAEDPPLDDEFQPGPAMATQKQIDLLKTFSGEVNLPKLLDKHGYKVSKASELTQEQAQTIINEAAEIASPNESKNS